MTLLIALDLPPMEASNRDMIPTGEGWQYEPKWDGFRCLAFRDGGDVQLQSKSGQPLRRYFPDIVAALARAAAKRFVVDGEIVIEVNGVPDFEALQMRLHPAESRVRKLAAEHPARYMLFDLLAEGTKDFTRQPLRERRAMLTALMPKLGDPAIALSPATLDVAVARRWLDRLERGRDGVLAKRVDAPYRSGKRDAMVKIKRARTADCVIGGFRYLRAKKQVGSLLLGLYDAQGRLDHVGFTSTIPNDGRSALTQRLEAMVEPPGFTGSAPGGPSRWNRGREHPWFPLRPELVVEVAFDHVSGGRFRHGTTLLRWRPDKAPRQCTCDQIV